MKPRLHIVHATNHLELPTLIESKAVRSRFELTKSDRLNHHAQLVYTQTYGASNVIHCLASCDKPYIVHMGGDIWNEIMEDQKRLRAVHNVLVRATLVVANSAFLYRILLSHGLTNAAFLPGGLWGFDESVYGIMPTRFEPKQVHPERPKRFLMSIALKVPQKYLGIELFMRRAAKKLAEMGAEVICAGKTLNSGFARRMTREYGIDFIGKRQDWDKYLPEADVFLHPSLFDCFPRALAEAKCAGLPCLSFQVAGNVEVGDAPIYVDPVSEAEICDALEALKDRGFREYLGWMGRQRALAKTEAHRMDYPAIFEEVLREGPARLIRESKEALR